MSLLFHITDGEYISKISVLFISFEELATWFHMTLTEDVHIFSIKMCTGEGGHYL